MATERERSCLWKRSTRTEGPLFDIGGRAGGQLARLCSGGPARDELFAALLAELDSSTALTVVVIEDVHWADESTLDLLSFLGRRPPGHSTRRAAWSGHPRHAGAESRTEVVTSQFSYSSRSQPSKRVISR